MFLFFFNFMIASEFLLLHIKRISTWQIFRAKQKACFDSFGAINIVPQSEIDMF